MQKTSGKGLRIAYIVVAVLMALMMFFSASTKLTQNPGAVHVIHEVVGVPLIYFPILAGLEIAGGLGLLVGIVRPMTGVAAAIGLVGYFVGAFVAHVRVSDWEGLKSPVVPFLMAVAVLVLRLKSMRPRRAVG